MYDLQPDADLSDLPCQQKYTVSDEEFLSMDDEHITMLARQLGSIGFSDNLMSYNRQSKAKLGLAHRVCNERKRTGTALTHLSGYERNKSLWIVNKQL